MSKPTRKVIATALAFGLCTSATVAEPEPNHVVCEDPRDDRWTERTLNPLDRWDEWMSYIRCLVNRGAGVAELRRELAKDRKHLDEYRRSVAERLRWERRLAAAFGTDHTGELNGYLDERVAHVAGALGTVGLTAVDRSHANGHSKACSQISGANRARAYARALGEARGATGTSIAATPSAELQATIAKSARDAPAVPAPPEGRNIPPQTSPTIAAATGEVDGDDLRIAGAGITATVRDGAERMQRRSAEGFDQNAVTRRHRERIEALARKQPRERCAPGEDLNERAHSRGAQRAVGDRWASAPHVFGVRKPGDNDRVYCDTQGQAVVSPTRQFYERGKCLLGSSTTASRSWVGYSCSWSGRDGGWELRGPCGAERHLPRNVLRTFKAERRAACWAEPIDVAPTAPHLRPRCRYANYIELLPQWEGANLLRDRRVGQLPERIRQAERSLEERAASVALANQLAGAAETRRLFNRALQHLTDTLGEEDPMTAHWRGAEACRAEVYRRCASDPAALHEAAPLEAEPWHRGLQTSCVATTPCAARRGDAP